MIIYMAGSISDKREMLFLNIIKNRLFSFFYHKKEFHDEFLIRIKLK